MIVLVDAGNTRLKWGALDASASGPGAWQRLRHVGASAQASIADLDTAIAALPAPVRRLVASNVAGAQVGASIEAAAARAGLAVEWVRAGAQGCGVRNRYDDPSRLGSDRWATIIGAWQRFGRAALVVNCGTATTCDVLSANGEFLGGAILPGLELMKRSLATNTAQLPLVEGACVATPRNTADAIETGCREAQAGAISRMLERCERDALLVMTGGAGERIAPLVRATTGRAVELLAHLTLEGLAALACEPAAAGKGAS